MNENYEPINRRQALEKIASSLWGAAFLFAGSSAYAYRKELDKINNELRIGEELKQMLDEFSRNRKLTPEYNNFVNLKEEIPLEKVPSQEISVAEPQIVQKPKYVFDIREFEKPGDFKIGKESDVLLLAKTIFCEGREYWRDNKSPTFGGLVADSVQQRAVLTGRDLASVVHEPGQYSFLYDHNKRFFKNPLRNAAKDSEDKRAWEVAYNIALERLNEGPYSQDKAVTHFWTNIVDEPRWARNHKPKFVKSGRGKTTRFYYRPECLN